MTIFLGVNRRVAQIVLTFSPRACQSHIRAKSRWASPERAPPDPLSAGQPASEWFARTTESISYENLSEKVPVGSSNLIFALACFALSPTARAVTPAPDGGYPGENTAEGDVALFSLDTSQGADNTAIGFAALYNNTTGSNNTAIGFAALTSLTTGSDNTATGDGALNSLTIASENTATGHAALFYNTIGSENTANGFDALVSNTTGNLNAAIGSQALLLNTTGSANTAAGEAALHNNTTGGSNIVLGFQAGMNLTTGNFNIDIGNLGVAGESKRIRIGTAGAQTKTFIAHGQGKRSDSRAETGDLPL